MWNWAQIIHAALFVIAKAWKQMYINRHWLNNFGILATLIGILGCDF